MEGEPEEVPKPPKRPLVTTRDEDAWVVKVPGWLAEVWQDTARDTVLGEVEVIEGTGAAKPKIKGVLNSSVVGKDAPTKFVLTALARPPAEFILSDDLAGEVEIEASVSNNFNLRPTDITAATRLASKRVNQADFRQKEPTKIVEHDNAPRARHHVFKNELVAGKRKTKGGRTISRDKIPEEKLIPILFQMFNDQEYWGFVQLNKQLNQPVDHLKKILEKVCTYNTAGINKATWKLKYEYKSHKLLKKESDQDVGDSRK